MSKPFDLEAAKVGAKFHQVNDPKVMCTFVGVRANGSIAYECAEYCELHWAPTENLRMCSTKVVRWVNIYRFGSWGPYSTNGLSFGLVHDQEQGARNDTSPGRVCTARLEWEE